jgi:cyclophilin family peptidyl-prolyl cis-trans isomerase/HEAT repeat protein
MQVRAMRGTVVALAALLLLVQYLSAGCGADPERELQLQAVARWEDQRLADPDSLNRMMTQADAHVRLAATRAAGLIGRNEALPALIDALTDRSAAVREQAAFSLGILGSEEALPALTAATESEYEGLRVAALEGLAHLDHDGSVFLAFALQDDTREAIAAWNGLRNRADQAEHGALLQAIRAGLSRPETEILWRVLRCAERAPDSTLVAQIAPFARTSSDQIRVHALRALGRHEGPEALQAVLASQKANTRLRGRKRERVEIAQLRALGRLAGPTLAADQEGGLHSVAGRVATILIAGAGSESAHVSRTALTAMATAVSGIPLPFEAAQQASLMPVWRIRLARAARDQLANPTIAVRAAALDAYGTVRGVGSQAEIEAALADAALPVRAQALQSLGSFGLDATEQYRIFLTRYRRGVAPDEKVAILNALAPPWSHLAELGERPYLDELSHADCYRDAAWALFVEALSDTDFVVQATAAPFLQHFPGGLSCAQLLRAYAEAVTLSEGVSDLRLAILDGLDGLFAAAAEEPAYRPLCLNREWFADSAAAARAGAADTLAVIALGEAHRQFTARLLRSAFDDHDLRIRLKAREVALNSQLLPENLIPAAASLRATLPAVVRDPRQPPVRTAFAAPKLLCQTSRGDFVIQLDGRVAPNTCATILALTERGFYDGLTFHRVVPDFVIQGGDPRGDGWGGPGFSIRSEWSRIPYERGTVGIAHSGKDTGDSQWFVCHSAQPHLNGRYTVFGRVIDGMEIVDQIQLEDIFNLEIIEN